MRNEEELAILTGLLDFYSDRATAHASFVVAGIFGIYAVLLGEITSILSPIVFALAYLGLLAFDVYSFMNFGYYALQADITKEKLEGVHLEEYEMEMKKKLRERSPHLFYRFRHIKRHGFRGKTKFGFLLLLWIMTVVLPFTGIFFPFPSFISAWICVVVGVILTSYVVFRAYKMRKSE